MEYGFTTAAYVVSAVLFILSLGGLSGQESAKRAVWYGITGMALAVAATLIGPGSGLWYLSMIMIAWWRLHRLSIGDQGANDANARTGGCDALTCWFGSGFRGLYRALLNWVTCLVGNG